MTFRFAALLLALAAPVALTAQDHDRSPRTHDSAPTYHDSSPRPTGQGTTSSHR